MRNSRRRPGTSLALSVILLVVTVQPGWLSAQEAGPAAQALRPVAVRWYHVGAGVGVVALASLLDESLRDELQGSRSGGRDDLAAAFRRMGQPEIYAVVGLGTLAVGLVSGNERIRGAGGRITAALVTTGVATTLLKEVVGRRRPSVSRDAFQFRPFAGGTAWPSGHTSMAFALAASVADEIHSTPVTVGLYAAATLTGWSRLNDNRHWLSDVLAGAALGITSAKLMNGRWRVLGISGPRFLLAPGVVGVSLRF